MKNGFASPAIAGTSNQVEARTWIAVIAGLLGAFMAILDIQITNASLKEILGTLSATLDEGSWIATAYLVAEIIAIPLTVLFARIFGMRNYIIVNTALFLCFSTLCTFAWNLPSMIIFRALQGFTGGALIPMAMTLVLTYLPPSKRAIGLALFGLTATLSPTIGPTVGGYFTQLYGWPSIFYINWIPGFLLIAGIAYGLDSQSKQLHLLRNTDWIGIAFMALGLGALTIFLEEGNANDWLNSDFIVLMATLAFIGLTGWIINSLFSKNPFINLKLYGQRNFLVATMISAVAGLGLYGSAFILPLFLAQISNYTPMQIGEVIMWAGLPQLVMMPLVAKMTPKIDNRTLCSVGLALFGISCLMNSTMDATTGLDQLIASQVVRAIGLPMIMLTLSNFAMNGMNFKDIPSASSLYNMTRNLGGSIGIALLATALTNREQFHSARLGESISLFATQTQLRLEQLTQTFLSEQSDLLLAENSAITILDNLVRREAYVMAYNDCFFIMGMTLLLSSVFVWFSDKVAVH